MYTVKVLSVENETQDHTQGVQVGGDNGNITTEDYEVATSWFKLRMKFIKFQVNILLIDGELSRTHYFYERPE